VSAIIVVITDVFSHEALIAALSSI
jgi:hypothetical protein